MTLDLKPDRARVTVAEIGIPSASEAEPDEDLHDGNTFLVVDPLGLTWSHTRHLDGRHSFRAELAW